MAQEVEQQSTRLKNEAKGAREPAELGCCGHRDGQSRAEFKVRSSDVTFTTNAMTTSCVHASIALTFQKESSCQSHLLPKGGIVGVFQNSYNMVLLLSKSE